MNENNSSNVSSAFAMLIEEIETETELANQAGARA
jgi:hypothetical protein